MPTGYTADLHDGNPITFERFVLTCSRAMGAAVMQRDEPLDSEIRDREVDEHYAANIAKAKRKLDEGLRRSVADWEEAQQQEIAEATEARDSYIARKSEIKARYDAMLHDVLAWVPPTEEHVGLKKFMVDQIEESIRFDCGDWNPSVPVAKPTVDYAEERIGRLAQNLIDEQKREREERERVASQNAWVRALRVSLRTDADA